MLLVFTYIYKILSKSDRLLHIYLKHPCSQISLNVLIKAVTHRAGKKKFVYQSLHSNVF